MTSFGKGRGPSKRSRTSTFFFLSRALTEGAIGQSEGGLLLNIRKLFMKQALERSEQNFVIKLNHAPQITWGLCYISMPNGLPLAQSQGEL